MLRRAKRRGSRRTRFVIRSSLLFLSSEVAAFDQRSVDLL